MTAGAYSLKRGDTHDPECSLTTHRLRVARGILSGMGIEATVEHGGNFTQGPYGKHACCDKCKTVWPEWVTDEVFNLAYKLADEVQTQRGRHHQREINAARRA
jgi:hypothetical protein